jgi:hypothetical protein
MWKMQEECKLLQESHNRARVQGCTGLAVSLSTLATTACAFYRHTCHPQIHLYSSADRSRLDLAGNFP